MTNLIGQQLGRYVIQAEIGRGGMARVYRALDTSLQRIVALKVLAPHLGADPEFARRFEREAITAGNLNHPNIVKIFDVGEQEHLRYFAMEYVNGRTLYAVLKEHGALGLGTAVAIIEPVAQALDYAHAQGAVHRDIKPQNILIDTAGHVLLTDFGIAQAEQHREERLTRTGIFMGTPEYISPEQASAQRVDGRSDLYSLGIATYEAITGMVPFSGATPQLIIAHVQTPPPPISTVDTTQPPELDVVLARALAKNPDRRFHTGAAFIEALKIVMRRNGIAQATTEQIAALVAPQPEGSAGRPASVPRVPTPSPANPPPIPAPREQAAPPVNQPPLPRIASTDETMRASSAVKRPRPQPPEPGPFTDDAPPAPAAASGMPWRWFALGGGLAAVILLIVFAMARPGTPPLPQPTPTLAPATVQSPTAPPPTDVPPTNVPPTEIVPTQEPPTPTPEPPTPEPVPPTVAPVPPTPLPPTPEPPTPEPPTQEPPTQEPPTATVEVPTPTVELPTLTPTLSPSPLPTPVPLMTETPTSTGAAPTATPTAQAITSPSPTFTATATPSWTPTFSPTPSNTPTVAPTEPPTPTGVPTETPTPTDTSTPTP